MNSIFSNSNSEAVPLQRAARTGNYFPVATAGQTFGTKYFLMSTLIASIIPIIKLGIGLHYKFDCPIDQRIPTYMIVAGACGLALVGFSLLLSITFRCFLSESTTLTLIASCGLCVNVVATLLISIFMFIWFIFGCVWVFSIQKRVNFDEPSSANYCHPTLYKWTYALLVVTIVFVLLQCCISCIKQCCKANNAQN